MRRTIPALVLLIAGILAGARPADANQRFIVRTTSLPLLQNGCLLNLCNVVQGLDGGLNQLFLVEFPGTQPANVLLTVLRIIPGVVNAEVDVLQSLGTGSTPSNVAPTSSDQTSTQYYGSIVLSGYAVQPALTTIRLPEARAAFHVTGAAVVADIDTGVDPSHPALANSLLPGYDFTRNQPGGSEMTDLSDPSAGGDCPQCADVNRASTARPSTGAVLDSPGDGFGHGTMVLGIVHLVAPTARLLPLKAFHSDGTGYTSDIIRAVYYAVQNNANVINMSFDFTSPSTEFANSINYATQKGLICVASAGNDGTQEIVYPAALKGVMGVASVNNSGGRSSFSNYGTQIVWVAAPGENITTTFPNGQYEQGSGTSFSAPFVTGTVALILNLQPQASPAAAAADVAHAEPLAPNMGHGLLDTYLALQSAQNTH